MQTYGIGRLTLHPNRELRDRGAPVAIGGRALDLLSALAAADGGVVTKDELLECVWRGAIVEDNALQAQVSAARKALGSEAARLVTVHGRGYRLELDGPAAVPTAASAPATAAAPGSMVVFGFENLTGDPANEYLCDGIAEELVASFAAIPDLLVPAFGASMAFRGSGLDMRAMARELGVATVLEGSLRSATHSLRVSATLFDVASGSRLWSQGFERDPGDLLALHDDIARGVAAALGRQFVPRRGRPSCGESMRLATQATRMVRTIQVEAVSRGAELARKAALLDPGYARAWVTLAGAMFQLLVNGVGGRRELDEARAHVTRGLELDESVSGGRSILGILCGLAGDWLEAAENLVRATRLEPHSGVRGIALALNGPLPAGRLGDAARLAQESNTFVAARGYPSMVRALCASLIGDFAKARRELDSALLSGDPPRTPLFEMVLSDEAYARGAFDEALTPVLASVTRAQGSADTEQIIRHVFAAFAGEADRAMASESALDLFVRADRSGLVWRNPESPAPFARWQVRLGNLDAAFAIIRRIVERWRETGLLATGALIPFWAFDMAPFRADPRFQDIVRELGLFAYWERYGPPDGHLVRDGRLIVL